MPTKGWKLINVSGMKTCQQKNAKGILRTWYWCEKDCHDQPCWCRRKNCRSKAKYKQLMTDKKKNNAGKQPESTTSSDSVDVKTNEDFKISLCLMVREEDMKMLEEQYFKGAGRIHDCIKYVFAFMLFFCCQSLISYFV